MKYVLCLIITLCMVSVSFAKPDQCRKGTCKVPDQVKKVKVVTADQVKVKAGFPLKAPEPSIQQPKMRKFLNKFRREFV